ncbi:MAG: ABC transporter permease, partial [Deltaproteobacteria bacterium]|nr:ABC transporter permease [Deltaproteobacteria bacterium]
VLSQKIGALVGTEVKLIFPGLEGHGSPKVVSVQVVGIVRMGMFDYDSKYIFTRLSFLQQILDAPTQVTAFKMKLRTLASSGLVAERLSKSFGYPFRAKDWSTLNKNFFYAIHLEKVVISILLAVIIIVAAFNVASTLMMMIHDKSKEIAILKALGFPASQSFRLFCYIGMGIAVLGGGLGLLLGLGANYILAKTELIRLPAQIYSLDFLPVIERWNEILIILGVALCVVFVATLIPAFHVSRKPPIEALRYE